MRRYFTFIVLLAGLIYPVLAIPVPIGFNKIRTESVAADPQYLSGSELTGLLASYRMNETSGNSPDSTGTYDLTANAAPGTATGIITNGRSTSIVLSSYFSQGNGVFDRPGADWTWSGWINFTTTLTSMHIITKYDGDLPNSQYTFYRDPGAESGHLRFVTYGSHDECGSPVYTETAVAGNLDISASTWYFVCFGVEGGDVFLSENGGSKLTTTMTDPMQNGTPLELRFGARVGGDHFSGVLDEWLYYNRALTPTEITSIYRGGLGKTKAP